MTAIVATLVGAVTLSRLFRQHAYSWVLNVTQEATAGALPWTSDSTWGWVTEWTAFLSLAAPPIFVAVLIYGLGKPFTDTETRCRNCGYILRGLTEPRCPECGEGI